jgi:hypothetical protein
LIIDGAGTSLSALFEPDETLVHAVGKRECAGILHTSSAIPGSTEQPTVVGRRW